MAFWLSARHWHIPNPIWIIAISLPCEPCANTLNNKDLISKFINHFTDVLENNTFHMSRPMFHVLMPQASPKTPSYSRTTHTPATRSLAPLHPPHPPHTPLHLSHQHSFDVDNRKSCTKWDFFVRIEGNKYGSSLKYLLCIRICIVYLGPGLGVSFYYIICIICMQTWIG